MVSKTSKAKPTKPCRAKKRTSSKVAGRASYIMKNTKEVRKQIDWLRDLLGEASMLLEQGERVAASALGQKESQGG